MSRRALRGLMIGSIALGLGVAGTLVANAQWAIPGQGTARVITAAMPAGGVPTAEGIGDKVLVRWDAQTISPGVKMTAYVVTAHDTDLTPLPSVVRTVAASGSEGESVTFAAAELAGGKWKWAIRPKFQSWTGPEGALSNPKLIFPAAAPTNALAKAVAAATGTEAAPAAAPAAAVEATSTPVPTPSEAPTTKPVTDPTPSVSEKEPAKTESAKADPTPSERPSAVDPLPVESAE